MKSNLQDRRAKRAGSLSPRAEELASAQPHASADAGWFLWVRRPRHESATALALCAVLVWVAQFHHFRDLGLYEDDYFFISEAMGKPPAYLVTRFQTAFTVLPQGRPLGFFLPDLLSFVGDKRRPGGYLPARVRARHAQHVPLLSTPAGARAGRAGGRWRRGVLFVPGRYHQDPADPRFSAPAVAHVRVAGGAGLRRGPLAPGVSALRRGAAVV